MTHWFPAPWVQEPGGGCAVGSHTVNVLPAPTALSTVMWPSCSSAKSRAIARPRPVPPRSRLIHAEEAVEDPLHMLGGDAGPRVSHAHAYHLPVGLERERDAAVGRVADGVGGEVQEN